MVTNKFEKLPHCYSASNVYSNGNTDYDGMNHQIYKLTCTNRICNWTTMPNELKIPRKFFVAIPIPDSMVSCGVMSTSGNLYF